MNGVTIFLLRRMPKSQKELAIPYWKAFWRQSLKRKEGTDPQTILQERAAKIHILTITDRNRTLAIFSEDGKNMDDCVPTLFDMRIKKEADVSEEGCDEYPDL